jgi:hypothetical protein
VARVRLEDESIMEERPYPFHPPSPKLVFISLGALLLVIGVAVWRSMRAQPDQSVSARDPDVLERLIASPGETATDGEVYEDRAKARAAARAYREACRWRGYAYHYRIEETTEGFVWLAWVATEEENDGEPDSRNA